MTSDSAASAAADSGERTTANSAANMTLRLLSSAVLSRNTLLLLVGDDADGLDDSERCRLRAPSLSSRLLL